MRSVAERAARVIALLALIPAALALGRHPVVATSVRRALGDWTTTAVRVTLDTTPSPVERDWLAAVRRSGVPVAWTWRRTPPAAIGVAATPLADPAGVTRVAVAAPNGTPVALADRLGPIDTGRVSSGGLTLTVPASFRTIRASGARASVADSLVLRPLLVLGTVGWETKFVVRALEERGWSVDTRLTLDPHHTVFQGASPPIDTAHYAAVIAMDSGARSAAAPVARYAQQGGGVIIAGSAGRVLGAIAPAQLGEWRDARPLSYFRLMGKDSLVARAGDVMQIGYDATWRLRMDSTRGPAAHRDWWAALVASVAYAPDVRVPAAPGDDPAPVAATVDRLGVAAGSNGRAPGWPAPGVWFGVIVAALGFEWASRRLRGAP